MVTVQRAIEMLGAQARPPRALCPRGFIAGHTLGRPGDDALQKWILMDALGLLREPTRPGEVVRRDYT